MTRTMQRAVALFAALALASVWHADASCATTQTFKQLQPSVRAWKKDTFSNVAHDTPILEGTTPRVAERVSRTGLPTLTSYPPFFSPFRRAANRPRRGPVRGGVDRHAKRKGARED